MWRLYRGPEMVAETDQKPAWKAKGHWEADDRKIPDILKAMRIRKVRYALSPMEFMLRFSIAEQMAVEASEDEAVKTFLRRLNDPRLTQVDVSHPVVGDAMNLLASLGLIEASRIPAILEGIEE